MAKFTLRELSLVGILMLFNAINNAFSDSETKPTITFDSVGQTWENITNGSNQTVFYSPTGNDLFVICRAPYPIQWKIHGIIVRNVIHSLILL